MRMDVEMGEGNSKARGEHRAQVCCCTPLHTCGVQIQLLLSSSAAKLMDGLRSFLCFSEA